MELLVVDFKARHLPQIITKEKVTEQMMQQAELLQKYGQGYTAMLCGDPVGAAGVLMRTNEYGEIWGWFSPVVKRMPKAFFKIIYQGLNQIIVDKKPEKLFSFVDLNDPTAARFLKHLGFKPTHWLYERVP